MLPGVLARSCVEPRGQRVGGIFSPALGLKVSFVGTEDREGGRGSDHLVKIPGIKEQSLPKF